MLDPDAMRKLDQVVATFVEVATTTHFALYTGYMNKGFSEIQAFELVADYSIHHNSGLKDIAVLVAEKEVTMDNSEDDFMNDD